MDAALSSAPETGQGLWQGKKRALRVLLVEDSHTMRIFLSQKLRALLPDVHVLEAEDGKSAMRRLTTESVDLVVTDLRMPGMDGEDLVQTLKGNPLLRRKPILVISAELPVARFEACQGVAYLAKPVDEVAIRAALAGLLNG